MDIDNLPIEIMEQLGDVIDEITDMECCYNDMEVGPDRYDLFDLIIERHTDFWVAVESIRREAKRERLRNKLKLIKGGKDGNDD